MRGRGRGRGRAARGRRGGVSRGRGKKNVKVIESDDEEQQEESHEDASNSKEDSSQKSVQPPPQDENLPPQIDLEADISQLEAPTFTTLNRGPPEPMLHLRWDHKVSLIGEKVLNPMIHSCDQCKKPILIYGRMIPCKHIFCLACARKEDKACPRCMDPVSRVEQANLGTVFMCTHGGSRYGNTGCRRTYLSQRDLQAHINHRHSISGGDASPKVTAAPVAQTQQQPTRKLVPQTPPVAQSNDPRSESSAGYRAPSRTNLITVPIQQEPPPPPPPPPPPQQNIYHPQGGGVQPPGYPGHPGPPPVPVAPVQYGGGYPSGYYPPAPPGSYPPPQYPPPPPPDQPPQQYWQHPPPMHQFYR